ncbi:MAG: glycosyltransferase family 2 protein [Candidatus Moraniibacteriota bacterium]
MQPILSVAICSYRSPEMLRLCLQSVLEASQVLGESTELIVSDSATLEATETLLREDFPEIKFIPHKRNVGFSALVNDALEVVQGEFIFLMNHDVILEKDTLVHLIRYKRAHPDIGILAPKQLNFNGTFQPTCFRFYRIVTILYRRTWFKYLPWAKKHLEWFTMKDYNHQEPWAVDWVMGSALLVKREDVRAVGPMDRRFWMYMEDVDWCRRFWESGLSVVYFPGATLRHYLGKGSARGGFLRSLLFNRLTWYHIASAVKYFWKYRGKSLPSHPTTL